MVLDHLHDLGRTDDWMPGYAESLARLHALTGPGDAGALPAWSGPTAADVDSFLALARALDVPVPPRAVEELTALLDRLDPAPHHALLHGDPCPGNDLRTAEGVRFVDFERASLGNGLVELAYFRIGFPTCWCAMSVTAAPLAEVEDVYRTTWRGLTGREVPGDLADACAYWLIQGDALVERAHRGTVDQLARVPAEDFEWGRVSARERLVHRLGVVVRHDPRPRSSPRRGPPQLRPGRTAAGALAEAAAAAHPRGPPMVLGRLRAGGRPVTSRVSDMSITPRAALIGVSYSS